MTPTNRQKAQQLLEHAQGLARLTDARPATLALIAIGRALMGVADILESIRASKSGEKDQERES